MTTADSHPLETDRVGAWMLGMVVLIVLAALVMAIYVVASNPVTVGILAGTTAAAIVVPYAIGRAIIRSVTGGDHQ